jgi:hypothetical protein
MRRWKQTLSMRRAATNKRDATDLAKADAEIDVQFAKIPGKENKAIVKHSFKNHSGRVGRTSTKTLSEKVLRAVIAYVRHRHTEYDAMLRYRKQRTDARKVTSKEIEIVLQRWGMKKEHCLKKIKIEDCDHAEYVDG